MRLFRNRLFLFILVFFFLLSGCGSLFFYPHKQFYDNPLARQFSPEDVFFKTPDGLTLHGWFFRARPNARATILVLHGNAENLSTHVNSVLWLIQEGFNVFIFDYRGYGKSEGKPAIRGVHLDAEAALETVLRLQPQKSKLVVLGQSIGGAIAVHTVANSEHRGRVDALVIDSAFASYRLIAREKLGQFFLTWPFQYPLSFLFTDDYSPVKWIRRISPIPLLIMHGQKDDVVPIRHGRLLYDAALDPKVFWETQSPGHVRSFQDPGTRKKFARYLAVLLHENASTTR